MILGFDFGMKYIGVATGQLVTKTATPLTTLRAQDGIPNWEEVSKLMQDWQPTLIIVGLPLNMDGSVQNITLCTQKFANRIKAKFKIPVELVDERLSSWEVKQNQGNSPKLTAKQLEVRNAEAAALIVQQWLNKQ